MGGIVNAVYVGFQAFLNAGAYVVLPVIITLLGVIFRLKITKAFQAGIVIAVGFVGINLLVNLLKDNVGPAAQAMVHNFGITLDVTDVGWGAIASVTWASPIVALLVFEILAINIIMIILKKTSTMDVDIWNYHHLLTVGILVFWVTHNVAFGILASAIMAVITFKLADWTQPFVENFFGIPNVTLPTISALSSVLVVAPMNFVIDRLPGIKNINFSIKGVQKYIGFLGDPVMLGLILGCGIGALALFPPEKIFLTGINVAAVMALMPKMTAMFVEGLIPISEAARKFCSERIKGVELHIGLDAAVIVGNPSVITLALIMVPITIGLAVILPGNRMLPLADLAVLTFRVAMVVAICRGNMFRSILISCVVVVLILYGGTFAAPYLTGLARSTGLEFNGLIASMTGPSLTQSALVFWSFVLDPVVFVPLVVIVFCGVWYLVEKRIGIAKVRTYAEQYEEQE